MSDSNQQTNTNPNGSDGAKEQDGLITESMVPITSEKLDNIQFADGEENQEIRVRSLPDPTFDYGNQNDSGLQEVLTRSIRIMNGTMIPGTPLIFQTWYPYLDWARNALIADKINNFKYFRGHLRIKAVVNASPFHYGRYALVWLPYNATTKNINMWTTPLYTNTRWWATFLHCPHVFLDFSTSSGGEMVVPWFYPKNFADLTIDSDLEQLGRLTLIQLNQLETASSDLTAQAYISIYIEMEDPIIMGATSAVAQSKKKSKRPKITFKNSGGQDEYAESKPGMISGPADKVAGIAEAVEPFFGPFATATKIAAKAVGGIASLFGFSRPNIIGESSYFKNQPFASLANTSHYDQANKLTWDPKQELSVDPRITGLSDVDEMSLGYLITRPSMMYKMDWAMSDTLGTVLMEAFVTPQIYLGSLHEGASAFQPSSMMYASLPFDAWSGTIKFHFQIVATQYHRGRLKITYDPDESALGGTMASAAAETTNFNFIVDLSNHTEFTVEVPWVRDVPYLKLKPRNGLGAYNSSTIAATGLPTGFFGYVNGKIVVSVLNELSAPVAGADIQINCWVSGGEDLRFRGASTDSTAATNTQVSITDPVGANGPSSFVAQSGVVDVPSSTLTNLTTYSMVQSKDTDEHDDMLVCFGDSIGSLRTLFKRYQLDFVNTTERTGTHGDYKAINTVVRNFPYMQNDPAFQPYADSLANPYFFKWSPWMSVYSGGYAGWRGSIRRKYYSNLGNQTFTVCTANRVADNKAPTFGDTDLALTTDSESRAAMRIIDNTLDSSMGMHVQMLQTQEGVELELPFYSTTRFNTFNNRKEFDTDGMHKVRFEFNVESGLAHRQAVYSLVAGGEDFSYFFFTGPPVLFLVDPESVTPA